MSKAGIGHRSKKPARSRGRAPSLRALADIGTALEGLPRRRDLLIEALHRIQDRYGHVRADYLRAIAHAFDLAAAEVFEVATFYHHFDVVQDGQPAPPPVTVRVCDSLSCRLAGAETLNVGLQGALGAEVRIQRVPCVGRCEHAPIAVAGTNPIDRADPASVLAAVNGGALRASPPAGPIDYRRYLKDGGYRLLQEVAAGHPNAEAVISALEHAQLRGLGGAGFPAGRKWRAVRDQPAPRLAAINIDEGEPGTFKDRYYLERDPHRFLEGALIAAHVVGIDEIYLYLRDEYAGCRTLLQTEIEILQRNPPCPLPPIHLRRGAGAYICGEESAMIESVEGKRGMPRLRPPFVAETGLFGRPTLEHNLETLHWVRDILQRGPQWFAGHGRRGRKGLRTFSVSGRVRRPGAYLAPAGISVRELIDEYCGGMPPGHRFYAYFPGGASGGILPASLGDLPLDFDTLQAHGCFIGSAAIIVLSEQDKARDAALNAMRFFRDESCGKCTPCRVGTAKAVQLMEQPVWDRTLLNELAQVMGETSICGLGQAAPNPLRSVMRYFSTELNDERG